MRFLSRSSFVAGAVIGSLSPLTSFIPTRVHAQPSIPGYQCHLPKSAELGYVIMRRKELESDAFTEALKPFIDDLNELETEGGDLVDDIGVFERTDCRAFARDAETLSDQARQHDAQCHSSALEPQAYAACLEAHAQLVASGAALVQTRSRLEAMGDEYERKMADFDRRAHKARANAEQVLNYDNTEQVLRLYVWWTQKQRGGPGCQEASPLTSCEAFARIATALGRKIKNRDLFVDYLVRALVEARPFDLSILVGDPRFKPITGSAFGATGFKPEYLDKPCNNQVRHALGFIGAGYFKLGTPALVVSYFADKVFDSDEDFNLAVKGAELGVKLRRGEYTTQSFGDAFRAEICRR